MRKNSASDDQFAIPIYWWLMAHSLCTRRLRGSTGVERSSSASAARENNKSVDVESIHLALLPFFLGCVYTLLLSSVESSVMAAGHCLDVFISLHQHRRSRHQRTIVYIYIRHPTRKIYYL